MDILKINGSGAERRTLAELDDLLGEDHGFVWVDIPVCDAEAVRVLTEVFGFHPLAVKDCTERNRVPKMHAYADHVFVVLHAPEPGDRGHVHYLEIDQFIGRNYLVTVHGPNNPAVSAEAAERETRAVGERLSNGRLLPATPADLSHAIVAALIRNQEEYVEHVTADVWRLEQQVTGGDVADPEAFLTALFRARHGLLTVRTMAALSQALYTHLAALPGLPAASRVSVDDTADRFTRVRRITDGQREYLQGVIGFYQSLLTLRSTMVGQTQNERVRELTEASYAQNEEVKKISAWAAIFFAPSLVAAVYGMNFEHMPELGWLLGYPFSLALMAAAGIALYWAFKRRGWL
ncbi:magnesium transporter CorA family protein [Actinoplanes couchii]|uniref:Magnesium transporter n=1 Tax=Actinoplanes couchii TaxID=403638 RepID=A0ABQ3XTH4_9ACTN|nr:magnesium transporter CorA family protein [Actinoplanes couchii]MDR6318709.1 Mg2+ and Co2+ transporter CorA [Actinoplanes couchii]GID61786.1 magnesium transporter [Actinoplanes couchii]